MFIPIIIFLTIFVLCYPLTFLIKADRDGFELYWLPRLCGGYASPRHIRKNKPESDVDQIQMTFPKKLIPVMHLHKLELTVVIGGCNPLKSALSAGAVYAALGAVTSVVLTMMKGFSAEPQLSVSMDMGRKGIEYCGECIFSLSCGDIIRRNLRLR